MKNWRAERQERYKYNMIRLDNTNRETLNFVVNRINEICQKKNFADGSFMCSLILFQLKQLDCNSPEKHLSEIIDSIYNLIDDLKLLIQTEIRYVLFPLPDIKKEAYEMGKKFMKNFLEWIKPEGNYTPEKLMGILEDEAYTLEELKKLMDKIVKVKVEIKP